MDNFKYLEYGDFSMLVDIMKTDFVPKDTCVVTYTEPSRLSEDFFLEKWSLIKQSNFSIIRNTCPKCFFSDVSIELHFCFGKNRMNDRRYIEHLQDISYNTSNDYKWKEVIVDRPMKAWKEFQYYWFVELEKMGNTYNWSPDAMVSPLTNLLLKWQ